MTDSTTPVARPIDAMIIGAEKAGTSSLAQYLAQHPGICTHEKLEMTFFVRDDEYAKGYPAAFASHFARQCGEGQMILAKNVGCMYIDGAIGRLQQHNPAMKLVMVLRNPVDRAYSAYWYARQMGRETLPSFSEAIATEPARQATGSAAEKRYNLYLDRGMYGRQLQDIIRHFPRGQLHVVLFEDLKAKPVDTCQDILTFLGLPPHPIHIAEKHNTAAQAKSPALARALSGQSILNKVFARVLPESLRRSIKRKIRKANRAEITIPPLDSSTRQSLQVHFGDDLRLAESILGISLDSWRQTAV